MKLAALVCFSLCANPAAAMEFQARGKVLFAQGEIVEGDAGRFSNSIQSFDRDEMGNLHVVVSLSSPGGNLFEGMRLGAAIRAAGIPTLVERGNICASACSIAFLGGQASGVTNDAVLRQIEPGAHLGFHGFYATDDRVRVENETLDEARLVNAVIFEYATRMGDVDIGMLSRLLNTPPSEIEEIDTPREIRGLGIRLLDNSLRPQKGWAATACRETVSGLLGHLDPMGIDNRLAGNPEPMADLAAFRNRLLGDRYPDDDANAGVRAAIMTLPPGPGIDLLAGQPIHTDAPKVGSWRQKLERGSGFYWDACYAVTDFDSIWTIVVDSSSSASATARSDALLGYPADKPLW